MFNVKKRMVRYLIGAVLGLLAGAILYFVQPVQWKGQALVRIGQISQNQNQNSYPVEPLPAVVERLKSRSFIQAVAERAKRDEIVALLNVEEGAGLTTKQTRNGDFLIITVVGGSADLVRVSIDSVVAELVSKHDAILNAYQVDIRKELSKLDLERGVLSKRLATMLDGQAVARPKPVDERGLVTGFGVMTIQHDLEYKLNRSSLLRESISSANIRPTSLMESVSVTERRMFSSLWRACLFGALLGFVLSAIWVRWKK
jgi:hypothetical protein